QAAPFRRHRRRLPRIDGARGPYPFRSSFPISPRGRTPSSLAISSLHRHGGVSSNVPRGSDLSTTFDVGELGHRGDAPLRVRPANSPQHTGETTNEPH